MTRPTARLATHEVADQPGPAPEGDPWAGDRALRAWVGAMGGDAAAPAALGAAIAAGGAFEAGREARRHPPEARIFDAAGRRLDEVRFHPAYHDLMRLGLGAGYAAVAWEGGAGGHVAHAAMVYLMTQAEPGVCCPMTMTYAAVPALDAEPDLAALWRPRLAARLYDPAPAPVEGKRAATLGMAMTEKQGGSDLRATATRAERDGGAWRLTGRKWFCSAPMSDGLLTLAQAPGGSPASWCRVGWRGGATGSTSSGSRTSSATTPTPRPRSSTTARSPTAWARRAAACQPSCAWSTTPGSTPRWRRRG